MQKFFFVRLNGRYVKINLSEIIYIEGCRNYVRMVTETKSYLVLFSMKGIENLLPDGLFKRIHRSFIVSLDKITGFDSYRVYIKDKELPIGQQYKGELEKVVTIVDDTMDELFATNHLYQVPLVINANQRNNLSEAG